MKKSMATLAAFLVASNLIWGVYAHHLPIAIVKNININPLTSLAYCNKALSAIESF